MSNNNGHIPTNPTTTDINFSDEYELDLRELMRIIINKWILIVSLIVIGVVLAFVLNYFMDPVYESVAEVIVDQQTNELSSMSFLPTQRGDKLSNRIQIIHSPLVINRAKAILEEQGQKEAGYNLYSRLQTNVIADTDVIRIKVTAPTKEYAQSAAQAITDAYKEYSRSRATEQSKRVLSFLTEQVERSKLEVETAEEAVRDYQKNVGIISLDDEASKINEHLTQLEQQQLTNFISLQEKNMLLARYTNQLAEIKKDLPEHVVLVTEQLVRELKQQLASLRAERIDLLNRGLEDNSPEVKSLSRRINNLEQSIQEYSIQLISENVSTSSSLERHSQLLTDKTLLEAEIKGLEYRMDLLDERIEVYEKQLNNLSDKVYDLARLQLDVSISKNTYSMLSQELERSRIAVEREIGDVQIIRSAEMPKSPIKPRKKLNIIIAAFLGLFLGVGLAFAFEYLDNTVKDEKDVERLTNLPVLAVIPNIDLVDHNSGYGREENNG